MEVWKKAKATTTAEKDLMELEVEYKKQEQKKRTTEELKKEKQTVTILGLFQNISNFIYFLLVKHLLIIFSAYPLKSLKFSFLGFFSVCFNFNVINMDTYTRLGMMIVIEMECKHFQRVFIKIFP